MRIIARATLIALLLPLVARAQADGPVTTKYRATANRIIDAALADSAGWHKLARFTDYSGPRFSGTPALERGIDWMLAEMKKDGLVNVRGEPAMVPRWVRGRESATLMTPRVANLPMLGLGGSVATPGGGITADVMVVTSFEDLTAKAAQARGKIVLFDVPFTTYGATVRYRSGGASAAAKVGAVAALVRSVTPYSMRTPHTGSMTYDSTVAKIPTAAITVEDAMMIHRMIDRGERVSVKLEMEAATLPDVQSRNAIGEIRGSERPDEVVVLGGHIDSWDVGVGAIATQIGKLLARIDAGGVAASGSGADIAPMMQLGVPGASLDVDGTRYFWFHHTDADTMDKIDPIEMQKCIAVLAVLAFVVADLPDLLPRAR